MDGAAEMFLLVVAALVIGATFLVRSCLSERDCLRRQGECAAGERASYSPLHGECECFRALPEAK